MINAYRNRMAAMGSYEGESRRRNSQKIMDASWMRDPATKPVFVKWCDSGLPVVDDDDVPVYAKYNVKSYHTITGDEVSYLLQFRIEDLKNRLDNLAYLYSHSDKNNNRIEERIANSEFYRSQLSIK